VKKHLARLALCLFIILTFSFMASAEEVRWRELTLHFAFGERTGIYTGTLENGLPNGRGKFESVNSEGTAWYYEGDFVDGHFQGEGKCTWVSGEYIEEGFYKDDELFNGRYYSNGRWYDVTEGKRDDGGMEWATLVIILLTIAVFVFVFAVFKTTLSPSSQAVREKNAQKKVSPPAKRYDIADRRAQYLESITEYQDEEEYQDADGEYTVAAEEPPAKQTATQHIECFSCGTASEVPAGNFINCPNCGSAAVIRKEPP